MQCEMVEGGAQGNKLILATFQNMWRNGGISTFYRGLPLGLIGVFPYRHAPPQIPCIYDGVWRQEWTSAIDLGTFEWLKRTYVKHRAKQLNCDEKDVQAGPLAVLGIGATSGSVGASMVYPLNLLRTRYIPFLTLVSWNFADEFLWRLQAQGTAAHPHTYTDFWDCFSRTYSKEGVRGLFKGLTPNLLKVCPAHKYSSPCRNVLTLSCRLFQLCPL